MLNRHDKYIDLYTVPVYAVCILRFIQRHVYDPLEKQKEH